MQSGIWEDARKRVEQMDQIYQQLEQQLESNPTRRNGRKLAKFAVRNYSGHYYSPTLEQYYLRRAEKSQKPLKPEMVEPNTVLHVMTSAYRTGGHTRIVERWIDTAPSDEIHSVVITRQRKKKQVPPRLIELVKQRDGSLICFPYLLPLDSKARRLRRLAQTYDSIVLHQNMTDPAPLMAFGPAGFPRPVIVFNHAGHSFWIGRNAADLVIDIETSQNRITQEKRGIKNTLMLSLPYDAMNLPPHREKKELRKKLNLAEAGKVLISMASAYKFTPILDYDFPEMLRAILSKQDQAIALIIGVAEKQTEQWEQLEKDFPGRVLLLGILPNESVADYLQAADLYIDSFPYSSFTSMLDAVSIGRLPVLNLRNPIGTLPFIEGTPACIDTVDEMIDRVLELLSDQQQSAELYEQLQANVDRLTNAATFQERVHEAYAQARAVPKDDQRFLPVSHAITKFDILSNELCIERKKL
jgi:glycosyltransferase involved in cell wall biosynthesis